MSRFWSSIRAFPPKAAVGTGQDDGAHSVAGLRLPQVLEERRQHCAQSRMRP